MSYNFHAQAMRVMKRAHSFDRMASRNSRRKVIGLFGQAATLSRYTYAPPYLGLSETWILDEIIGRVFWDGSDGGDMLDWAHDAASKALSIDPKSYRAAVLMGTCKLLRFDHQSAKEHFDHALSLSALDVQKDVWYALFLFVSGERDAGLKVAGEQFQDKPENQGLLIAYGFCFTLIGVTNKLGVFLGKQSMRFQERACIMCLKGFYIWNSTVL
jgi:hypothetical protein